MLRETATTLLIACLLLTACATAQIGKDFNTSNLAALDRGRTTMAQATQIMGRAPDSTAVGQTGALGHTWQFIESKGMVGQVSSTTKRVTLVFNVDGTFQRVLQLQGVDLADADRQRLFALK